MPHNFDLTLTFSYLSLITYLYNECFEHLNGIFLSPSYHIHVSQDTLDIEKYKNFNNAIEIHHENDIQLSF